MPVTAPSPPVVWLGLGLIPFRMLLDAVKVAESVLVENSEILHHCHDQSIAHLKES